MNGVDLTQTANLLTLCGTSGARGRAEAALCLEDDVQRQAVQAADAQARSLGVSGVPFFIFDQRIAVSGAQEPDVLLRALSESQAAREPAEQG